MFYFLLGYLCQILFILYLLHPYLKLCLCGFLGVCASGHNGFLLNLDLATAWFAVTGVASKGIQIRPSFLTRNVLAIIIMLIVHVYFLNTKLILFLLKKLTEENKIIQLPSTEGSLVLAFYCLYILSCPPPRFFIMEI